MKSLVIYDSAFGNTKKIAEAIAKKMDSDLLYIADVKPENLTQYQLIIIGSPIQGWRPLPAVTNFLNSLSRGQLKGVKAIAFDTRINIFVHGDAVQKIAKGLKRAGAEILGTEFFYVEDKEGPVKPGELERAVIWADGFK